MGATFVQTLLHVYYCSETLLARPILAKHSTEPCTIGCPLDIKCHLHLAMLSLIMRVWWRAVRPLLSDARCYSQSCGIKETKGLGQGRGHGLGVIRANPSVAAQGGGKPRRDCSVLSHNRPSFLIELAKQIESYQSVRAFARDVQSIPFVLYFRKRASAEFRRTGQPFFHQPRLSLETLPILRSTKMISMPSRPPAACLRGTMLEFCRWANPLAPSR